MNQAERVRRDGECGVDGVQPIYEALRKHRGILVARLWPMNVLVREMPNLAPRNWKLYTIELCRRCNGGLKHPSPQLHRDHPEYGSYSQETTGYRFHTSDKDVTRVLKYLMVWTLSAAHIIHDRALNNAADGVSKTWDTTVHYPVARTRI